MISFAKVPDETAALPPEAKSRESEVEELAEWLPMQAQTGNSQSSAAEQHWRSPDRRILVKLMIPYPQHEKLLARAASDRTRRPVEPDFLP